VNETYLTQVVSGNCCAYLRPKLTIQSSIYRRQFKDAIIAALIVNVVKDLLVSLLLNPHLAVSPLERDNNQHK